MQALQVFMVSDKRRKIACHLVCPIKRTSETEVHQVTADNVETRAPTAYEDFSVEPGPHGDMDKTPINDAVKPNTEKQSSKKSKKDDQNVQWLGDKVNILTSSWM